MPHDPVIIAVLGYAATVVLGAAMGGTGRIIVFADLRDLFTTFSIVAGAGVSSYLLLAVVGEDQPIVPVLICAVVAAAFSAICYRAWRQNASVPAAALAVLTKLPFAVVVPVLVLQLAVPSGKTGAERARSRAVALLLLTIVAPLMLALVRDKGGLQRYLGVA